MTPPQVFATTHWTLVQRTRGESPEARAALAELCEAYWTPVFRFLRRDGRDEDAARELTQEFFTRLLAGSGVRSADPAHGRFRTYLLGAVKHFLADQRERDGRLKRGAGVVPQSLDAPASGPSDTAVGLQVPDPAAPLSDRWFDREWALAVMDRALRSLEREYASAGKTGHYQVLKTWLGGGEPDRPQAEAARQLGLTEGAFKVALHRLRRRLRDLVRADLAQTLPEGTDPDEELGYLIEVLADFTAGSAR